MRGRVHLALGRYKRAISDLNRALLQMPDHSEIRFHLGLAKEKSGNLNGAREDYIRAYRSAMEVADERVAQLVVRQFPDVQQ